MAGDGTGSGKRLEDISQKPESVVAGEPEGGAK